MTNQLYPDPDCTTCRGYGYVTDWVPYGSTNVPMETGCECLSENEVGLEIDAAPEWDEPTNECLCCGRENTSDTCECSPTVGRCRDCRALADLDDGLCGECEYEREMSEDPGYLNLGHYDL